MIITVDEKHPDLFKAQVKEGESIRWRGQLDWNDKNAGLSMEYWLDGEKILSRRIEKKWYWVLFGNALEAELREFYRDGMKRADQIRKAKADSIKMSDDAKNVFREE